MLSGWLGGKFKELTNKQWKFIVDTLNDNAWNAVALSEAGHEDLKMFEHPSNTGFDFVKVTGTIPCSLDVAKSLFTSTEVELIKNWDPDILKFVEMQKLGDNAHVVFVTYSLPYPIYHRTFLTVKERRDEAEGWVVMYASINSKDVPVDPNFVRGTVTASAYIVKPIEGKTNECHLTRFVAVDPKGAIPGWVVNASKGKMAKGFVGLRNYLKAKHPNGV